MQYELRVNNMHRYLIIIGLIAISISLKAQEDSGLLAIVHEIDSGYQQEWKLFKLPGESSFFMVIHIPLVAALLYGLLEVANGTQLGWAASLLVSIVGLGCFGIHTFFIRKGNLEFTSPTSQGILYTILAVSLTQLYFTLWG